MSISPVSNINALFGVQPSQNQGVSKPQSSSTQQPTDTVQLSPAAQQHLGVDKDGDGDGH